MKVLRLNKAGQPREVILTDSEQRMSEVFESLLDDGKGIVEAAKEATKDGCDPAFYDWLTQ